MRREIWSLTGLRGVAAFLVIMYHFGQPSVDVGMASRFHIPKAYLAVDCFFMLSGFVLSYNYASTFGSGALRATYLDFCAKRFARIYPAFAGVTLLYLLRLKINFSGDHSIDTFGWKDAIGNLFVATGWGVGVRPIVGDSWSVSAELVCYLVFPLLVGLVFRRGAWPGFVAVLAALLGYVIIAGSGAGSKGWLDVVSFSNGYPLLRALCGFLLGMVLNRVYAAYEERLRPFSSLMAGCGLAVLAISVTLLDNDALNLACIFAIVLGLAFDGRLARWLFATPVSMYLGRISYSLYLVHVIFVSAAFRLALRLAPSIGTAAAYWLAFGLYLCVAVAVATLSYEIFEVRGRRAVMFLFGMGRDRALAKAT